LHALLAGERLQIEIAAIDENAFDTHLPKECLNVSMKTRLADQDKGDACDRSRLPPSKWDLRLRLFVHAEIRPIQAGLSPRQEGRDEGKGTPCNADAVPGAVRHGADRAVRQETAIIAFADLVIDLGGRKVWRGGRPILLTRIEFELLHVLSRVPGKVLSRRQLITGAWPQRIHVEPRTVTIHVGHLRKRLMGDGASDLIRTVRGAGYALEASATSAATEDTPKTQRGSQP
jgi:DNA-binding winged helix-turn-helix (wHTH) protein